MEARKGIVDWSIKREININNLKGQFICFFWGLLSLAIYPNSLMAKENIYYQITEIEININPIFELDQNDGWLYKTTNKLHIDTKEEVIRRVLPIKVGDQITVKDIEEAERILRGHRYLRDAKIKLSKSINGSKLIVSTWENWTLFPTIDVNRQGGETEYSYGIKDDNLLGMGIAANIAYFSESDRSGHILSLSSDAISDDHLRAGLVLADNSDGEQVKIFLNKPFYTLDQRHSVGISFDSHQQDVSIDVNEQLVNQFASDRQFAELFFGYSTGKTDTGIYRWLGGVTHEKYDFESLAFTSLIAGSRDLTYPWIAFEYQQDKFKKTKNLYLLERTEDIQLGWYHYLKVGFNLESSYRNNAWVWQLNSSYFGQWNENNWYRAGISGNGVHSANEITNAYYNSYYEHFFRVNDFKTWYGRASYRVSENPYIDRPMSLGGETGLRGFPLEYQHGNKQWLVNLEKRFYPKVNIWQLLDVAFVGYLDVGRSFGENLYANEETGPLASAGFGLRFFLTRSSGRNVISVNFSQPLNSDFVKDFDVSVIVRTQF